MPRTDQDTKRKRVELAYRLLERHPNGLKEKEIADMLNFGRRAVNNYLHELEIQGQVYKDGVLWFAMPYRRTRLRQLDVSPEEAMTLYLATRLLAKQHDKRNESAETALVKLAEALTGDLDVGREIYQAAKELTQRPGDESYSRVFRTLMQSYIYRRKVTITYRPLRGKAFETLMAPYLLEPSAIGYATYVIGHSSIVNDLRTYKLERIQEAALTREEYVVPPDFPGLDYLRSAWSIISGDEVIPVELRFSPGVAERVRETRWHPSQEIVDDPERPSGCIWTAQVADLKDFVPWVRSWGADVEVLGPEDLREKLVKETQRMALLYDVGNVAPPPLYQRLWAKAEKSSGETHPLICHMIDVGAVALAMWNEVLTESVRARFADTLGLNEESAGRLIAFWAALHDLGKATPAFQEKYGPAQITLSDAGLPFPKSYGRERFYHGTATSRLLPDLLAAETNTPRRWRKGVALAVGGHHGAWPIPAEMQGLKPYRLGDGEWEEVRVALVRAVRELLAPDAPADDSLPREARNALLTLLSGLTSVADWVGSMERYFPFVALPIDLAQYAERAKQQAQAALEDLRWTAWTPPATARTFTELFQLPEPRPMQAQVIDLAEQLRQPSLVIIEAPTGVGKTEAALYLADHWARLLQQRGLYIAMPTMATSNQMYDRVGDVMERRYPDTGPQVLLIHSQARWSRDEPPRKVNVARGDLADESESEQESVDSMAWFLPRKRSLLAPFGVGTVDQTFLGVLQTRHFFVRLFGLSHKTLIFDEVHAYDTYMSTLFQRLLGWLRAVGTSVVILSATLPKETRRELVRAYTGSDEAVPEAPYPAITWASGGKVNVLPVQAPQPRSLALEWLSREPEDVMHRLQAELWEGGCAAVICNTVGRAQEVYRALRQARLVPEQDLTLFHARFPTGWRREIEARVLSDFGKDGRRPEKAIVVATQVIEQSLDLDFDVMISDLAPVDLLLQRAGRLHRHDRDARPAPLAAPRLFVTAPDLDEGVPDWGSDAYIYEAYVLLRSYLILRGHEQIVLPDDTSPLIEGVYGPEEPDAGALAPALLEARRKMRRDEEKARDVARGKLIKLPQADNLLRKSNANLAEEAPEVHDAFRALTRLSRPSLSVVCLHRVERQGAPNTEPDGSGAAVDLEEKPDADLTATLVGASVSLSHGGVFPHLIRQEPPPGWRNHTLLRNYRVAIFEDGVCPLEDCAYTLVLRRDTGLEIVKDSD